MAYLRWSFSNWYVFWLSARTTHKHQEKLACWYVSSSNHLYLDYLSVKKFIKSPDWTMWDGPPMEWGIEQEINSFGTTKKIESEDIIKIDIPSQDREELLEAMREWIQEVDKEFGK